MENKFKDMLKELREERGLSMNELGKAIGCVNHAMIAGWESGRVKPGLDYLIMLARFFEVTCGQLMGEEEY